MSKLRYAIIGTGMMGREHIQNLALIDDVAITAIADPDDGMRAAAARLTGGGVQAFDDYRDMIARDLADVFVLATPNHTHAGVLKNVLPLDRPILVEKPLCTTVADCHAIKRAANGRSAPIWVAMEYRYMPPVARLIREVENGTIGDLKMLAIREHRFPFKEKVGDWNRFARNTGGTMVEKCCHFFDLMRLITKSEAVRVFASGGQDVNHLDESYDGERPDMIDNAFVTVDFENGVRALLDLCMFAEISPDQEQIAATGDRGKVECGVPSSTFFVGDRRSETVTRETIPVDPALLEVGEHHGSTYYQHRAFVDAVKNGAQANVSLDDGLHAVAIGAAAEQSIKTGRPVLMKDILPRV